MFFYSPVTNFHVARYHMDQILEIETKGGNREVKVLHIHKNKMITEDISGKRRKRRVWIDEEIIKESYDCLYPSNKVIYGGWWNRKINII